MASTDTAICRLNICWQLFIKDNWCIGMVMCLIVHETGLYLWHCCLKLGLPFPSFPVLSCPQPSHSTSSWETHWLCAWSGEGSRRRGLQRGISHPVPSFSLQFVCMHTGLCATRWGEAMGRERLRWSWSLEHESTGSFVFRCRLLLLGNCPSPSQDPICRELYFQSITPWHYSALMSQTIEQVKSAETWNELSL